MDNSAVTLEKTVVYNLNMTKNDIQIVGNQSSPLSQTDRSQTGCSHHTDSDRLQSAGNLSIFIEIHLQTLDNLSENDCRQSDQSPVVM